MNAALGILLALIMAFSSIGGTPVQSEEPVSFDAKISLDGEAILNLAGAGATGWAFGSQICSGHTPALAAKPVASRPPIRYSLLLVITPGS